MNRLRLVALLCLLPGLLAPAATSDPSPSPEQTVLLKARVATQKVPVSATERVLREVHEVEDASLQDVLTEADSTADHHDQPAAPKTHHAASQHTFRSWSKLFQWSIRQSTKNATSATPPSSATTTSTTTSSSASRGPEITLLDGHADRSHMTPAEQAARAARHEQLRAEAMARVHDHMASLHDDQESDFDVMARAVHVLKDPAADAADRITALYTLEELCHNIDNGKDLAVVDGVRAVSAVAVTRGSAPAQAQAPATTTDVSTQSAALWTMATCTQNNPVVQEQFVQLGVVGRLVELAEQKSTTSELKARCLFALASLLEGSQAGRSEFSAQPERSAAVLTEALEEEGNARAVRRALYIAELLLRSEEHTTMWMDHLARSSFTDRAHKLVRDEKNNLDVREAAAQYVARLRIQSTPKGRL